MLYILFAKNATETSGHFYEPAPFKSWHGKIINLIISLVIHELSQ